MSGHYFSEATLVRRSDATGTIGGEIVVTGAMDALKATGNLEVGPMEINLPERLPPAMTAVDVVEVNKPGQTGLPEEASQSSSPVQITLDIQSNLPGRIFVLEGGGSTPNGRESSSLPGPAASPS